tara:strand:+ start:13 stop:1989 length:1977 start_codon:yes stop_codon:yes gene_type:complete
MATATTAPTGILSNIDLKDFDLNDLTKFLTKVGKRTPILSNLVTTQMGDATLDNYTPEQIAAMIKTPAGDVYAPSEEEIRKRQAEDAERAKNTGLVPPKVNVEPLITPLPKLKSLLDDANITVEQPKIDTSSVTPFPKPVTADDLIITMDKGDLKTGKEYYDDLGGFDDVVTRNVLVNKNRRYIDIFTGKTNQDRKDRNTIRYNVSQNEDVNKFVENIKSLPKQSGFGDADAQTKYTQELVEQFSDLYNQKNPMLNEYLSLELGRNTFSVLRKNASLIPAEEGGITQETINEMGSLPVSSSMKNMDLIVQRAETSLRNYKTDNPKATGYELKGNKIGDINIEDIFFKDEKLKNYLTTTKGDPNLERGITDRGVSEGKKYALIKKLKEAGLFEELGLENFSFFGAKVKPINDPKIDKYLLDNNIDKLPKDFKFTEIMNDDQRLIISQVQNQVGKLTAGQGNVNKKVAGLISENVNRMVKYGLRDQGKTIDEVMESFKKQTNDADFLEKVVPLMIEKVENQNDINLLQRLGIDIDDVNLSHITAVNKDIDLTFKINNIFIGKAKLNSEEEAIQTTIRANNRKLNNKNLSNEEINKIKQNTENLQFELESKDYYKPVSSTYTTTDVESQVKEKISESMFQDPTYFKKNGGMVGISHLTRSL